MSMVNPEMMQNLMNNPEIQKMMKDPNLMNKFNDILGENKDESQLPNLNEELFNGLSNPVNSCPDEASCDPKKCCPDEASFKYSIGTKIETCHLKNDLFNNKYGIIEDVLDNGRYVILFDDKRIASIKENNLKNRYENLENIE